MIKTWERTDLFFYEKKLSKNVFNNLPVKRNILHMAFLLQRETETPTERNKVFLRQIHVYHRDHFSQFVT